MIFIAATRAGMKQLTQYSGRLRRIANLFTALVAALSATAAIAGGGPEGFLLVVNSASPSSLAIANHYIALRQIPSSNVLYLQWKGDPYTTDVETFRRQILQPILETIQERGLAAHIDGVIYSSDFPYSIDLAADLKRLSPNHQKLLDARVPGFASLNSLTYYYQLVLQQQPLYALWQAQTNLYHRPVTGGKELAKTHGFRGWYGWGQNGELLEVGGSRYFLSAILGVTAGKGNTVPEVISYLSRSAKADGNPPAGTVYFTKTNDPRSLPRQPWFEPAVTALKALGVSAEVLDSESPVGKQDIAGGMFGHANIGWDQRKNTILPGAAVDDLTSYGAEFKGNAAGQTLLSEFLRAGAAGSSGTAVEPLSNWAKFPLPFLFVHYARGCNLIESFYQSVMAPYQLVIVGDALCQPWAKIPHVEVSGIRNDEKLKGTMSVTPSASGGAAPVDRFELYVDGEMVARCHNGGQLQFDTASRPDGSHELRVVGIDSSPIETQGRIILPVTFDNHGLSMTLTPSANNVRLGDKVRLQAKATGVNRILVYASGQQWPINGEQGTVTIDTNALGAGPVTLRAIGLGSGGVVSHVLAAPVTIQVGTR
jgi:hypothetical protein